MKYKLIIVDKEGEEHIIGGPAEAVLVAVMKKVGGPKPGSAMFQVESVNQLYIAKDAKPAPIVAMLGTAYMAAELFRNHVKHIESFAIDTTRFKPIYDAVDTAIVEVTKAISGADEIQYGTQSAFVGPNDIEPDLDNMNKEKVTNRLKGRLNGNNPDVQ